MNHPALLLARLDAIAESLSRDPQAMALIGLGSVGLERERLDECSDLDFFVIVEPGTKSRFLDRLDWLHVPTAPAYVFRNTPDGYKALYEDGVFCEFAVFEPVELSGIPFAPGRVVWKREGVDDIIAKPVLPAPRPEERSADWLLGEALTNLYVGLSRFRRGEKLSAARFVQQFAVDRVIELHENAHPSIPALRDPFVPERRLEIAHPGLAEWLPRFMPGYQRTPEAALALLEFLAGRYPVNAVLAATIRRLAGEAGGTGKPINRPLGHNST